ncbi:MAG: 2-oxoglutarate dehydrogenase complex dihydrolipoyllysine-residue succinyltransferase [Fibrobacteres bacterium]|nr:2-oxoglutarate dehydrogenase complex dihydrolipoyllysine-residue succinyltransferase [Fibrobacterota bacterium]
MAIELVVPKVGESITEVQIVKWLKAEGDAVDRDANLAVIETDKATVELPSPVAGVLGKILKGDGATAKVGEVIGYMEEGAGKASTPASKGETRPEAKSGSALSFGPETGKVAIIKKEERAPAPSSAPAANPAPQASVNRPIEPAARAGEPIVMPAAARALAESGLKAQDVPASGPGGRLLKEDVMRQAEALAAPRPAPSAQAASPAGNRDEEAVPMSMLRRRVAERLVQAQQTAALLTTFNEVDMTEMLELRKRHQDAFTKKYGTKLGIMSFFVKASIEALKLVPQINAEIRGNEIIYKRYYDVGVAVGGGKGLVVPILRNAERMSFAEVELAIADFGKRAQANALKLEELQGGTFTISNGGVYGSLLSTPIVNPPQSGVLGMHATQDRPVARNGQVVIRPMMYVALTYDHRIVDGKEAVTFLKRIKDTLEDPARILLEI